MKRKSGLLIDPPAALAMCAVIPSKARVFLAVCLSVLVVVSGLSADAQSYSLDWFTIDGGGGTSTGGVYSVSGTIGQPDAGATSLTGGNYSLRGGYWAAVAVQMPDAPRLTIVPAGMGQARVSWTPDAPGWRLQETPTLSPAAWADSSSGATNPVVVPVSPVMKFFRVSKF